MAAKMKGVIKSVKKAEGFGFITHVDTGMDHFFHKSSLEQTSRKEWEELEVNDRVVFTSIDSPKGKRAIEVASM